MDEFFHSVAGAFEENRRGSVELLQVALLLLIGAFVALQLSSLWRRAQARRSQLRRFAFDHGLTTADLAYASALAGLAGVETMALLGQLDVFERTTARALGVSPALSVPGEPDPGARIARLRRALGFDRLPPFTPLLTTRELSPGTSVEVEGRPGTTFDVREDHFCVEVGGPVGLSPGMTSTLTLVHAREARYALRCRLLDTRASHTGERHLVFAHDEAPARIQLREYVRVHAKGPVVLHPLEPAAAQHELAENVRGELIDVSAGGALVSSRTWLPVGLLATASFALLDNGFMGLRAVVLSVARAPNGNCLAHLEFSGLGEAERARLVGAVTQLELSYRAAEQRRA